MRIHRTTIRTSLLALTLGTFGLVTACSDELEGDPNATPDAGTTNEDASSTPSQDSGQSDASTTDEDATTGDDAAAPAEAIAPTFTKTIPGALDPFGIAFGSDGKLYVSGATLVVTDATTVPPTTDQRLAVWRFDDSGALDTTFGTDGVMTVAVPGAETSYDIVELKSGDFVVHASSAAATGLAARVYLVKLAKQGDGSFAFGEPEHVAFDWDDGDFSAWPGTTATPVTTPGYTSWGIALDRSDAANEKIVVFAHGAPKKVTAGEQRTDNDRWITRVLTSDGFPIDPDFNGGAPFTVDIDGAKRPDNARRGIVQADGTIVSAGYTSFEPGANHVALVRLTKAGVADTSFGFGTAIAGHTKFNPFLAVSGEAEAYNVGRQSSGRYVTTGYGTSHFDAPTVKPDLVSFGVKDDDLDPQYGKLGSLAIQSEADPTAGASASTGFEERGRDLVVLADDRVVHAGRYDGLASLFVTTKDGALDEAVGHGGVISYNAETQFFKIAKSADGKRIAATARHLSSTSGTPAVTTTRALFVGLKVGQ